MKARRASVFDSSAIARIYNEGIAERTATFETEVRSETHIRKWFDRTTHPIIVVEIDRKVIAFAAAQPSSTRACYAKNAEFSVYVERAERGRGAGRLAMNELATVLRASGFNKLVSHVFADNAASRRMLRAVGFREAGTLERHGVLDGVWRDVVLVEKIL